MTADQIRTLIAALQAMLDEPAQKPIYPRLETIKGVQMMLSAPLNPLYRPSFYARLFGGQGQKFVADPSNAAEQENASLHLPLRSPAGFPLSYAIGWGDDGKRVVIGTPTVYNGDQAFNSDVEVMEAIRRDVKTPEQLAAEQAEWDKWALGMQGR